MRKASHQADGAQASSHLVAEYASDGDDWTVTVSDGVQSRSVHAVDILTAREAADRLARELHAGEGDPTVVHLLDGDALAFTSAYLTARHLTPRSDESRITERAEAADELPADAAAAEEKTAGATPRKKKDTASRRRRGSRTTAMPVEAAAPESTSDDAADSATGSDDTERPAADSA
ncbi:hypothetical protein FHR81_001231 [Actinoalloteichus hoggarensis]|uniref:Uncharacterized protein n=1 Tax=Actinoalloteichus hoggarensis TaxID=1470176 RepID=A0A221VZL0_9PSEU|nr:hypothetical protein [Actinoalloteichus hoggarensis]ASO18965.1 hypothetical protein AHOG_06580 [Actinoalloteichus hoggarensis]MBB5920201.1 hypothetical protein [Actinoalloteichus hoggarensis]